VQPLNLNNLTPWNLEAVHPIFLGEMVVNPRTFYSMTFTEVASMHKSPTLGVTLEHIKREAQAHNKYLKVSNFATSNKPLRPDLSDIEIALIHSTWNSTDPKLIADALNISVIRLKQVRKSTAHLYKQHNTALPQLPLVMLTDTSRYWTEDELLENYGDLKTTKDLLRGAPTQSQDLNLPVNAELYCAEDNKHTVCNGDAVLSEVSEENEERFRDLSDILWSYVSREDSISKTLLKADGGSYYPLTFKDLDPKTPVVSATISYISKVKGKVINHNHEETDINGPLRIPKPIIKLAVSIINKHQEDSTTVPSLEHMVIYLLSSLEYTTKQLNINIKPLSFNRGHCLPFKNKYIVNTEPQILEEYHEEHYGYGIICHDCSTFLSNKTKSTCKHLKIKTFITNKSPHAPQRPALYVYSSTNSSTFSLYYYNLDEFHNICSIFTLNLLEFYSNFHIPLHKLPYEA